MKNMVGYGISGLGLLAMAAGTFKENLNLSIIGAVPGNTLTIGGVIAVVIGLVLAKKTNKQSSKTAEQEDHEVPIYHEDKIVGYRRKKNSK